MSAFEKDALSPPDPCVVKITQIERGHHGWFAWCFSVNGILTAGEDSWEGNSPPEEAYLYVLSGLLLRHTGFREDNGAPTGGWMASRMRYYLSSDDRNPSFAEQKEILIARLREQKKEYQFRKTELEVVNGV